MPIRIRGGTRDGQLLDIDPHDDEDGRWIEFADTEEYYVSSGETDEEGNEVFVHMPLRTGPLTP